MLQGSMTGNGRPQELLLPVPSAYIAITLVAALVLNLLALPETVARLRPDLIALMLIYWVVYHPRRLGFLPAWALGLAMDVADGSLFGQHALSYALLMYLAILLHRRILMFGMLQQMLHVVALLLLSQAVTLVVRLAAGAEFPGGTYFVASLVGALLWPIVFTLLRLPLRPRTEAGAV